MELKCLISGIAVVIDDKLRCVDTDKRQKDGNEDLIVKIVEGLEKELNLPFYSANDIPPEQTWPNLLKSASFILLDWRLWPMGAAHLESKGVEKNIQFLKRAKDYFVPVFIFTNESLDDVEAKLPPCIYPRESPEKSFVFIREKSSLLSGDSLDFHAIEGWIRGNASVYALKTWEQAFHVAKKELFSSMYGRSPDWPRFFWKAYKDDGVDPSTSLTHLINDSLRGRMQTRAFEADILDVSHAQVPKEDLRALIGETSFRSLNSSPEVEIRCGDLFKQSKGKYLLNLRPDCDCIPRDGRTDEVELYCIEGKKMSDADLSAQYEDGHFSERVWESVAFSIHEGKSVRFNFGRFRLEKFSDLREGRIGRILHPYLTRIQQRFALYLQRQGLPRIPEAAISPCEDIENTKICT